MEPVTRRIALHYTTERLDACLVFYRDLLGFNVPKDMVLANGQRWLVVTHPDNDGIQLHFHPPREDESPHNSPRQLEFSHPDPQSLIPALRDAGHDVDEYEYPYTWGIMIDDPVGNRVCLSFWGDD